MARKPTGIAPEDESMQGGPPVAGPPTGAGGPQPAAPLDEELTQPASPEEQASYENFVGHAMKLLYDPKMMPRIVQMLRGSEGQSPVDALADTAQLVVKYVLDEATSAGDQPTTDVLVHAGQAVFELIAEMSTEAGIYDFSQDADALEGAWWKALDQFRVQLQKEGKLDQNIMAQDFAQLQQWDQSGFLQQALQKLNEEPPDTDADEAPTTGQVIEKKTGIAPEKSKEIVEQVGPRDRGDTPPMIDEGKYEEADDEDVPPRKRRR